MSAPWIVLAARLAVDEARQGLARAHRTTVPETIRAARQALEDAEHLLFDMPKEIDMHQAQADLAAARVRHDLQVEVLRECMREVNRLAQIVQELDPVVLPVNDWDKDGGGL